MDRVLGAAVRRLQRDRAIGERRADLHDGAAIARPHVLERRARAPHEAVIADVGDAAELVPATIDSTGPTAVVIALLIQTSIGPSSRSIRAAATSTCAASATSTAIASPRPPSRSMSASGRGEPIAAAREHRDASPACANRRAVARPTPAVPPVITMTRVMAGQRCERRSRRRDGCAPHRRRERPQTWTAARARTGRHAQRVVSARRRERDHGSQRSPGGTSTAVLVRRMTQTVSDHILQRLYALGRAHDLRLSRRRHQRPDRRARRARRAGSGSSRPRHEEIAAFMACAHAKFTGEVGVCMATSGPGAIHLLNGLYDAQMDHQPVVAIVGQAARTAMGADYQQEVDLLSLFKDVAHHYVHECNHPAAARHLIDRAMRIALAERTVTCVIVPQRRPGARRRRRAAARARHHAHRASAITAASSCRRCRRSARGRRGAQPRQEGRDAGRRRRARRAPTR